jgi:cytoskeleton protein RodZ
MESEQDSTSGEAPGGTASRAAAMLRDAREAQGLSLSDIAARTRIPLRQLEVIEAGAFASLPSRTYAIGFARTYARALELDEQNVMAAVRAELGDSGEQRAPATRAMEPGDPAKLPSKGLAWAGAIAAVLLAVGLFAWFGSRFGAGEGAPPLAVEAETESPAEPSSDLVEAAPVAGGEVVIMATADGVWVRLFEADGARLLEKTLTKGESFTVPAGAADPRINTARPDALTITIDGKPIAPLAERSVVLASEPVSAAALLARALPAATPATRAPSPVAVSTPVAVETVPSAPASRPVVTRTAAPVQDAPRAAPESAVTPAPAPAPASAGAEGDD